MRTLALALLLLVSGCADFAGDATPPPPETVKATFESRPSPDVFAIGFDGPQRQAIEAAAAEWCDASAGAKCPVLGDVGSSRIDLVDELPNRWGGEWYPIGDIYGGIRVRSDLDVGTLYLVALHEFGHHFGCPHTNDGSTMGEHIKLVKTPYITEKEVNCK